MEKPINFFSNCPPPSAFEKNKKLLNKTKEKIYYLNFDNNKYELIISLFNNIGDKQEKVFNFKLINNQSKIIGNDKLIYYENNKNTSELSKLFLINLSKCPSPESKILEKIEKFHLNNSVHLLKNDGCSNNINLIYILKAFDNDEIEFTIELIKKEEDSKERNNKFLYQEINFLKNTIQHMEQIIKAQNEEIKLLKEKVEYLINNNNNIYKNRKMNNNIEEKQLIFNTDLSSLNNIKIINADIDCGRGVNDHFEVFNIYKEKKSVYIAVKCKEEDSDISYIDIIKITSLNNYKKIKRLSGHQKRIVFIKYFINNYTNQEYLISGDKKK